MERVPLDVPNGGRQCAYNNINVFDVVVPEIPWFVSGVAGSTNSTVSSINSYVKSFLIAEKHPTTNFFDIDDGEKNAVMDLGAG